ncbi:MAG TPA: sugar phosphate isomerase/epimerase [Acidimicrobiia bacterium]|nr:sugar phosphate isomerase/epimerase [Acidimicrobiia bacterium]
MSIQLSCNDYAWPTLSHTVVMAIIADLGFGAIDVGLFADATHVTLASVRENPQRRAESLCRSVEQHGLVVADVFLTASLDLTRLTPTSRNAGDQAELQEIFAATVEFASATNAPGITLLPGVVSDNQSQHMAIALAAAGLAPLVGLGAERGLAVSVEPHVGSCIETPEATRDLLDLCPGLTVTLDPGHFAFLGTDVASMLTLADRVRHVQLRPGGHGVMQTRLPENRIDFRSLVTGLVESGYSGYLASEFVWMEKWGCDMTDNVAESGRLGQLLREILSEVDR